MSIESGPPALNAEELTAWDGYCGSLISQFDVEREIGRAAVAALADALILERRKRHLPFEERQAWDTYLSNTAAKFNVSSPPDCAVAAAEVADGFLAERRRRLAGAG